MNYYYITDPGKVRERNEDSVSIVENGTKEKLLIVADGMGGKDFGEVASTYVAKSIEQWFVSRGVSTINNFDKLEVQLRSRAQPDSDGTDRSRWAWRRARLRQARG